MGTPWTFGRKLHLRNDRGLIYPFYGQCGTEGIYNHQLDTLYGALRKNHSSGGLMARAGYEHNSTLGGGLDYYMDLGYVPIPYRKVNSEGIKMGPVLLWNMPIRIIPWPSWQTFGKDRDYGRFMERSKNYKNVFDTQAGWMRPKDSSGSWQADFDPYRYEYGFNEPTAPKPHGLYPMT